MQYHTRFKKSILHKDAFYKLVTILILLLSMAIMQRNSSSKNYFWPYKNANNSIITLYGTYKPMFSHTSPMSYMHTMTIQQHKLFYE